MDGVLVLSTSRTDDLHLYPGAHLCVYIGQNKQKKKLFVIEIYFFLFAEVYFIISMGLWQGDSCEALTSYQLSTFTMAAAFALTGAVVGVKEFIDEIRQGTA